MLFYTILTETEEQKTKIELLYKKYHKMMLYIAWDILREQMVAEDAVHSCFLRMIKYLDGIDIENERRTKRFIVIMIRHTAINIFNKRKREMTYSLDEMEDWQIPASEDIDFYDLPEENRVILAIKNMPELYRDVFLLKYSSGYENQEIADMLGITEESVRKRISRGKKKLEEILNKEGVL